MKEIPFGQTNKVSAVLNNPIFESALVLEVKYVIGVLSEDLLSFF
jgi:hypothetical protein